MLLQFSVENFLSFDAMTTFSMRATDEADHPGHVLERGAHRAVRGAALYGANAAGKSNLIKAMAYARDVIVSRNIATMPEATPFRLSNEANRPSGFHWQWIYAGRKWSYGFDIQGHSVVEEYLFAEPEAGGGEQLWFERRTDELGATRIELGEPLLGDRSSDDARLLELLAPRTSAYEMFLHRCFDNGIQAVAPIFTWFSGILSIVHAEMDYGPLILEASRNKELADFLSNQMRDAGTGIDEVVTHRESVESFIESPPFEDRELSARILSSVLNYFLTGELHDLSGARSNSVLENDEYGRAVVKSLFPIHAGKNGERNVFSWEEESEGTQRYLHLLPRLYLLQTRPTVLVIDELERRLHTKLTRRFVEQSIGIANLPESQLIFTTHDTNLLDKTLLRRDEIWFVDKGENGASSLYSMAQFKDFDSSNYEQAYLMGLFEAIPYFRNSHQLSPALRKTDENTDS